MHMIRDQICKIISQFIINAQSILFFLLDDLHSFSLVKSFGEPMKLTTPRKSDQSATCKLSGGIASRPKLRELTPSNMLYIPA